MRAEYDFSNGVRNKHAAAYQQYFPDAESVNNALRALISIAQKGVGKVGS